MNEQKLQVQKRDSIVKNCSRIAVDIVKHLLFAVFQCESTNRNTEGGERRRFSSQPRANQKSCFCYLLSPAIEIMAPLPSVETQKRYNYRRTAFCISLTLAIVFILIANQSSMYPPVRLSRRNASFPRITNASFREELIREHLVSYYQLYDNTSTGCNTTQVEAEPRQLKLNATSELLSTLRQQIIPYPNDHFHGRGIVLTVGPQQLSLAKVNLKMIEHSGTRLPVQIWYSSHEIKHEQALKVLHSAPKLNLTICSFQDAQCESSTRSWYIPSTLVFKPGGINLDKHFPAKPAAILSATFAEVLFLDSDAYLTRDPEDLFLADPMYLRFGALFYPDAHFSRQHLNIWKMLNTSCGQNEYELDSATILVDKRRVWNGLFITKLMNDHHRNFYGVYGDGDKDTFRLGFRYMKLNYYIVMFPCATGKFDGRRFCGWTLCKTDSLGQHIYVNHVHIFKHEAIPYRAENLAYTRIGLGNPNNNSFFFKHCRLAEMQTSCFHIVANPNAQIKRDGCYAGEIPLDDLEDHEYQPHESLLYENSRINRIILSRTENLIPHFVDNLLKYLK